MKRILSLKKVDLKCNIGLIHKECVEVNLIFTDRIYTGFSRGKRERDVKVFVKGNEDGLTSNIVYPELIS